MSAHDPQVSLERSEAARRYVNAYLAREERTMSWLCRRTGIELSTLWRRLHGHHPFRQSEIERIASALGVSPEELMQEPAYVAD